MDSASQTACVQKNESVDRLSKVSYRLWSLVVVFIAIASPYIVWRSIFAQQESPLPTPTVDLSIPASAMSLGTVWEDAQLKVSLPITNVSSTIQVIDDFRASCLTSGIEPRQLTIQPGETRNVKFKFDFGWRQFRRQKEALREFEIEVVPIVRNGSELRASTKWKLSGRVQSAIQCNPLEPTIGEHSVLAQPIRIESSFVTGCIPLKYIIVESDHSDIAACIAGAPGEDDEFEIRHVANAALPVGRIRGTVSITPVSRDGQRLPTRRFSLQGEVVEDVQSTPTEILFGILEIGENASEVLSLSSLTGTAFSVERVEVSGNGLTVVPVRDVFGAYAVRQKCDLIGQYRGVVMFDLRSATGRVWRMQIPVKYYGIRKG